MTDELTQWNELTAALARVQDVQEAGKLRAKVEVLAKTLGPRHVVDRFDAARAYVLACVKHGEFWNEAEKRGRGGDQRNKSYNDALLDFTAAGFKHRMDALRCARVAEMDVQDLEEYFEDCRMNGRYPTLGGAYSVWKELYEEIPDTPPLPDGLFSCIVADPPWPMQKIIRDKKRPAQAEMDYKTMSIEDIAALAVPAADDCHLYLWVTQKYLPAGLFVVEEWGFNYQCLMTWVKNVGFTPYSWMYDTEHVIFAARGNLPLRQMGLRLSFSADTIGHSVKPDVFYERVLRASPGPRLEMFARQEREGFIVWGNEVPMDGQQYPP